MLALSRRSGEAIVIPLPDGRLIRISVARLARSQVTLGIEADPSLGVYREELWKRMRGARNGHAG